MVVPNKIVKSKRKTLSISITQNGELVVRAPMRMSDHKINQYLLQKEQWIVSKQTHFQHAQTKYSKLLNGQTMLLGGTEYDVSVSNKHKQIVIQDNTIYLPNKYQHNQSLATREILLWYKKQTIQILNKQLQNLAASMQVSFKKVSISNSKNRWGTCDSKQQLKFNVRLAMLPPLCATYLMVHELAHLKQMNHSKQFYAVVQQQLPNYKQAQKLLKEYNVCMQLYR